MRFCSPNARSPATHGAARSPSKLGANSVARKYVCAAGSRPDRKSSISSENGKKLSMKSHGYAGADREPIGVADTPATFSWQANGIFSSRYVGFPYRVSLIVNLFIQNILRRNGGKRTAGILTLEKCGGGAARGNIYRMISSINHLLSAIYKYQARSIHDIGTRFAFLSTPQ